MLVVHSLGVAYGSRAILADVSFKLDEGMNVLVGPAGSGKTTLLRTLAGLNIQQPQMVTWGEATLNGSALERAAPPELVLQKERLLPLSVFECLRIGAPATSQIRSRQYVSRRLTDLGFDYLASQLDRSVGTLSFAGKRLLVLLRACLRDNPVLMADEPMAELSDDQAEPLLRILNAEAQRRTVLVVTHNQTRASALGGQTIFLAGGTVRTSAPTERFFDPAIATGLEAQFLETGRVSLPSINADPRTLSADSPRPLTVDIPARGRGPRSFHWLIPGRIGGCPRPGVVVNFDEDMRELQNLGITILVNLEEEVLYSEAAANEFGIEVIHEPVRDMSVPTLERARQLCRLLKRLGESGESVAVHCRAGQGRTGLVMAMVLISHGQAPADSFRVVQAINPRWIQSDEQLEFLPEFSGFLAVHGEGGPRREANLSAEGYVR